MNDQIIQRSSSSPIQSFVTPRRIIFLFIWLFGLYIVSYAQAPRALSPEEQMELNQIMNKADARVHLIRALENEYRQAEHDVYDAKTWFWRFDEKARKRVEARELVLDDVRLRLDQELRIQNEILNEGKQLVGIWSEYALEETRSKFWDAYARGKQFAKDHTMFHMMWTMGRDESLAAFLIRAVLELFANFTFGMIYSFFSFLFQLPALIRSYSTDYLSAVLFFGLALFGATTMLMTYVAAAAGTIGAGAVGVIAMSNNLLGDGARPRTRIAYQNGRYYERQQPDTRRNYDD